MLPQKYRLNSKEIALIARKGEKILKNGLYSIKLLPSNHSKTPLFAISISKKTARLAVERNLIKRKIRAAIISVLNELEESGELSENQASKSNLYRRGKFLIICHSKNIAHTSQQQLQQDFRQVLLPSRPLKK